MNYLIKDKKDIIETEKLRITDLEESIQKTENETAKYAVYQLFDQGLLPIEKVKIDDEESFSYYFMYKYHK